MRAPEFSNLERTRDEATNSAFQTELGEAQNLIIDWRIDAGRAQAVFIHTRQDGYAEEQHSGGSGARGRFDHGPPAAKVNREHFHA